MKIKGIEKLTEEQVNIMFWVNEKHRAAVGLDYKEDYKIKEAWVDENNIVCVRLKNNYWYHYTRGGDWY